MNNIIDTFANRLKYAITIRNIRPVDLSNKTGISKVNLSYYMSGKYEAKADGIKKLADALKVDPVWLMGYDVQMEDSSNFKNIQNFIAKDSSMSPLLDIGDIAKIEKKDTFNNGETILFILDNQEFIRKVIQLNDIIEFHAMNPYYPVLKYSDKDLQEKNFKLIGKVIKVENSSYFK